MKFCTKCGAEISNPKLKFCIKCGAKLAEDQPKISLEKSKTESQPQSITSTIKETKIKQQNTPR